MSNFSIENTSPLKPRFPDGIPIKIVLFVILNLFWSASLMLLNPELRAPEYTIEIFTFCLFNATLTIWLLDILDYFNLFHPIARPDSILTLALIVPLAASVSKYILLALFGVVLIRYRAAFLVSLPICGAIYLVQVLFGIAFVRSGARRKLALLTSRPEAAKVLRALRSRKLLKFYEPIYIEDLENLTSAQARELRWVIISRSEMHYFERNERVIEAMLLGTEMLDYREIIALLKGHLEIDSLDLWMYLTQSVAKGTIARSYYSGKAVLERVFSAILLIALSPLLLIAAIGVKLTSPGPVFFGQTRLGYQGKPFTIWKIRSMRQDAESAGHAWSKKGDQRVTKFGAFLRKTRLDEIPQLWNVIRGEMSLIGPRPERPEFYALLDKKIPAFRTRLLVRPGITGWAQVMGGYAASIAQTKRKLEYDLFYMQRMSPKIDVLITLKTVAVALRSVLR
ncbi:MAG: sugar transferase [Oligoflexia bacterium]|nr:sugar transferase [Oligoflexia bacterium]